MGGELSPDGDLSSRLKSGIPLGCSRFVRDGCGGVAVAQPLANYCDAAGILKRKRPVSKFHRSSQMELSSNSNQLSVHTFDCLGVDATNRTLFVDALRRQGFERVEQPSRSERRHTLSKFFFLWPNDRHHRVAVVDYDFRKRWPTPLRCMAWFVVELLVTHDGVGLQFTAESGKSGSLVTSCRIQFLHAASPKGMHSTPSFASPRRCGRQYASLQDTPSTRGRGSLW